MDKKEFAEPEVLVIRVEENDVLCTSQDECGTGTNETNFYSFF